MTTHHETPAAAAHTPALSRSLKTALWMVAAIGGFYLLREHGSHVASNWVYLLLLACPLMHLFHGHGGYSNKSNNSNKNEE